MAILKDRKAAKLEEETIAQIEKLTQTTFQNLKNKLDTHLTADENFILSLILLIHKKCSTELVLSLLYIIS